MGMIYYVIAFAAGLGITLQTTLNSQLARGLGGIPLPLHYFRLRSAHSALAFTYCCVEDCSPRLWQFLLNRCGVWREA